MPLTPSEEIQSIRSTVDRLDVEIQALKEQRASLLTRLNELNSTPRLLLPELLLEIFSRVHRDHSYQLDKIHYPLVQVIMRVCGSWRRTALTAPWLWSHFDIMLVNLHWTTMNSLDMLRFYARNSRSMPLAITLDKDPDWQQMRYSQGYFRTRGRYVPITDLFDLIMIELSDKLGALRIKDGVDLDRLWFGKIASCTISAHSIAGRTCYPNLTTLEFGTNVDPHRRLPVPKSQLFQTMNTPQLRRIILNYDISTVNVPLGNLTTLHLFQSGASNCIEILAQNPQLVEFHASFRNSIHDPSTLPSRSKRRNVTLPLLQELLWDFTYQAYDMILMTSFCFPALTSLHADNVRLTSAQASHNEFTLPLFWYEKPVEYMAQWTSFLNNLPSLRVLGCGPGYIQPGQSQVFKTIQTITTLEEFHVWGSTWGIEGDRAELLARLGPPSSAISTLQPSSTHSSPSIKSLYLYEPFARFSAHQVDKLLDVLEFRWRTPRDIHAAILPLQFCTFFLNPEPGTVGDDVDLENVLLQGWTNEQRLRLQQLREEGFKFLVRENVPGVLKAVPVVD